MAKSSAAAWEGVQCGHQQIQDRQQAYVDSFVKRKAQAVAMGTVSRRKRVSTQLNVVQRRRDSCAGTCMQSGNGARAYKNSNSASFAAFCVCASCKGDAVFLFSLPLLRLNRLNIAVST